MLSGVDSNKEQQSVQLAKLGSEVTILLGRADLDKNSIKEKMLKYISQKYKEIDARGSITQRLRDTFGKFQYLNEFSPELFESTVDEIKLYADSTIGIILTNKQEIRNGDIYGTT